jgi:SAM-dependent methyltransferase
MEQAKKPWYEDDDFWENRYELMFGAERWVRTPQEVDAMLGLLGATAPAKILDLCCGPGRHSVELARRGFDVTGVDRTRTYLARARNAAAAAAVRMELVEADMRVFRRERAFDCAINMFTAFGYFGDPLEDRRVLENLQASLVPGGKLLIELMGREILARKFTPRDWFEMGDTLVLTERRIEQDWTRMSARELYIRGSERSESVVDQRLYGAVDLTSLLREVGFVEAKAFGSLDGTPYDQDAQRLVVVATR